MASARDRARRGRSSSVVARAADFGHRTIRFTSQRGKIVFDGNDVRDVSFDQRNECRCERGTGPHAHRSRRTIAAGTLPNTEANLYAWISDPQRIKPGTLMPATKLDPRDLQALVVLPEAPQVTAPNRRDRKARCPWMTGPSASRWIGCGVEARDSGAGSRPRITRRSEGATSPRPSSSFCSAESRRR